jgi:hypothetical protein
MDNQVENQTKYQYIHVGIGIPGVRSYSIGVCRTFTSTCLVNSKYRELYKMYVASYVDYVIRKFIDNLDVLKNPFHTYKSRDRVYLVYRYNDKLWSLLEQILMFAEFLNSNRKLKHRKREIVESVLSKCRDVDRCIDSIIDTVNKLEFKMRKARERGKKALFTRFERNTQKCMYVVDKYFSDLRNVHIFDISHSCRDYYTSECEEKAFEILRKFYAEEIARRYSHGIAVGVDSVYLFARDGILAVKTIKSDEYFKLLCDSCVDNEKYAIVKLVGAKVFDNEVNRIDWIAVIGYDKHTNQVFLHYVPKTLVFRDVETCRKWILGLVDEYGRKVEDVDIIEV